MPFSAYGAAIPVFFLSHVFGFSGLASAQTCLVMAGSGIQDSTCCGSCIFAQKSETYIMTQTGITCQDTVLDVSYGNVTTTPDLMSSGPLSNVTSDVYMLIGAKSRSTTNTYIVAAVGRYIDVFKRTGSTTAVKALGPGAAHWYNAPGFSFGFAPNPNISLNLADTDQTNCSFRLSWQLDNALGGWRAGCTVGYAAENYRKIIKKCTSSRVGAAAGVHKMTYKPELLHVLHTESWQPGSSTLSPIKLGTPLTLDCCSKFATYGLMIRSAFQLFVEWVNTVYGGVKINGQRRPISLTLIDDRSDPINARTIAEHMVDDLGIKLFLGPYSEALTEPLADVVHSKGGTMVASLSSATNVFKNRNNVFGVFLSGSKTLKTALADLSRAGAKTIAYVQMQGQSLNINCNQIATIAQQTAVNMTFLWHMTLNQTNVGNSGEIQAVITRLDDTPPDVFLACVDQTPCEQIMSSIISQQIDLNAIVFTECVASASWRRKFGGNGLFVGGITPWLPTMKFTSVVSSWTTKDFSDAFQQAYEVNATYHAACAWTAGIAMLRAIENAGSTDPAKVAAALTNLDLKETIFGPVKFDTDGLNIHEMKLVQYLPESGDEAHQVSPFIGVDLVYPIPPWSVRQCFSKDGNGVCTQGLKNGQCITCPIGESAVWTWANDTNAGTGANAFGKTKGCVCKTNFCGIGLVVQYMPGGNTSCISCGLGKFAARTGLCTSCPVGKFANATEMSECTECPAGRASNTSGRMECDKCPPGRVTSEPGEHFCQYCRRGTNASQHGTSACRLCGPGTVAPTVGSMNCEVCAPGRMSVWGGWACENCAAGKFQSLPKMSECKACPIGTSCPSVGTRSPSNGENFWRYCDLPRHDKWFPCSEESICLSNEKCADGQTGVLCAVCLPGYSRSPTSAICRECHHFGLHLLVAILAAIVLMVFTMFTAALAVKSAGTAQAVSDALVKMLLNYLTTMGITSGVFRIIYLQKVKEEAARTGKVDNGSNIPFLSVLSVSVTEILVPLLSLPCLFDKGIDVNGRQYVDILRNSNHSMHLDQQLTAARDWLADFHWGAALRQQLFWFIAPPILLGALLVVSFAALHINLMRHRSWWQKVNSFTDEVSELGYFAARASSLASMETTEDVLKKLEARERKLWGVFQFCKYVDLKGKDFVNEFLADAQPIVVVGFFILYPTLVQALLDPLRCEEPMEGLLHASYARSYDLECYKMDDALFWLSLIGILLYCVGIPAFVMFHLYKNPNNFSSKFLRTWGFLTSGYEVSSQYWECIILFRKSLALILVSINMHQGVRVLLLLLLASSFSLMHISYKPFDNRFNELLDRVESKHLVVWVMYCLFILWTYLTALDDKTENATQPDSHGIYIVTGIMCTIHLLFLLMIVRQIIRHAAVGFAETIVHRAENRRQLEGIHEEEPVAEDPDFAHTKDAPIKTRSGLGKSVRDAVGDIVQHLHSGLQTKSARAELKAAWFGRWADKHYEYYLDRKAHLICDANNMWFTLLGNKSHKAKPTNYIDTKLSEVKIAVKPATEKQRRYLLKIIMEAFEYVIVTMKAETFSVSLLEFVLRCGFAFTPTGEPRLANSRMTPETRCSQIALKVACPKFVHPAFEPATSWSRVSSMKTSSTDRASALNTRPSERASTLNTRASDRSLKTTGSVEFENNGSAVMACRLSDANAVITPDEFSAMVTEMFQPDIFDSGLSLEELQFNLNMLRSTSQVKLQEWMECFELEWVSQRAQRVKAQFERKNQHHKQIEIDRSALQATETSVHVHDIDGMEKFKGKQDDDESDESESESDASLVGGWGLNSHINEVGVQAELAEDDVLANLITSFDDIEDNASNGSPAESCDDEMWSERIIGNWKRVAFGAQELFDMNLCKNPAAYALQKMRETEVVADDRVKALQSEIADAKAQLDSLQHVSKEDVLSVEAEELRKERADLDRTLKAIAEARDEVEDLKSQIAEHTKKLIPSGASNKPTMLGKEQAWFNIGSKISKELSCGVTPPRTSDAKIRREQCGVNILRASDSSKGTPRWMQGTCVGRK